jgi:hypothetical protein
MTRLSAKKPAAMAFFLMAAALPLDCQNKSSNDFSHIVKLNKNWSTSGDSITIDEVRGPSDKWIAGSTYEVRGTYKLTSRDKATLGAFVATSGPHSEGPASPEQIMDVSRGEGKFRLRFQLSRTDCPIGVSCGPHLSFYPVPGGNSFLDAFI